MFIGYVVLEETLNAAVMIRDSARSPTNVDGTVLVRIYGPDGLLAEASVEAELLDTASITDATNDTPIVITSAGHGLSTGVYITVTGVGGNTAANGSFRVTVVDDDTFELDGSTGNGPYTSGGTWSVSGLYVYSINATSANGFEVGTTYTAQISYEINSQPGVEVQTFIVV